MDLEQESEQVALLQQEIHTATTTLKEERRELQAAVARVTETQEALSLLQHIAQEVQQRAHVRISEVVSSCLAAVFDDPYELVVRFERKRGRTEAVLRFRRNHLEVDPLTACGGGQVDVAAFALRAACLALHRPRLRRLLVLDEPFRFVSVEYQPNIRTMLESLSAKLDMQIVMVTHNETYETGKVIRF